MSAMHTVLNGAIHNDCHNDHEDQPHARRAPFNATTISGPAQFTLRCRRPAIDPGSISSSWITDWPHLTPTEIPSPKPAGTYALSNKRKTSSSSFVLALIPGHPLSSSVSPSASSAASPSSKPSPWTSPLGPNYPSPPSPWSSPSLIASSRPHPHQQNPASLQRLSLGHTLIKRRRFAIVHTHNATGNPTWTVPMSMMWQVLPTAATGLGVVKHFPAQVAFYYQEFPSSMRSTAGLSYCWLRSGFMRAPRWSGL